MPIETSSTPTGSAKTAAPAEPHEDGAEVDDFKPLSAEEARHWRQRQPKTSVWRVVGWQCVLLVAAALIAWGLTSERSVVASVVYGGLCVVVPTALMAWGLTSSALSRALTQWFPGAARMSLAGVFFWEGIKVLLALAMMWSAPRWVPDLSWLGLLAGLVVVLKAYWLTFFLGSRRPL